MQVATFDLQVFEGRDVGQEPALRAHGAGEEWRQYQQLRLPGFDASISLSLEAFWATALRARQPVFEQEVIGVETIVKFGDTMQMKTKFTVRLEARFD